jgi:hypothetical protein
MNMNQEMLEILIGKYLDGEITPSEQQILETQLNKDPQSEMLLRQFQDLHERSSEVVASELLGQGKTPEEIFDLAYQRQSKNPFTKIAAYRGYIRFVSGVAAGLIIGLALHFVLPNASTIQNAPNIQYAVAPNTNNQANLQMRRLPQYLTDSAANVTRNVDWYNFTDKNGNQWLVEGLRENIVRPAVYDGQI